MLQAVESLSDGTPESGAVVLGYWLKGILAVDLEIGAEMHKSSARRKFGRPAHYWVIAPDGGTYIHYFRTEVTPENPRGESRHTSKSKVFGLSAYSDQEAIEKANKVLPRKYARFKTEVYREYVREEGKDFGRVWWEETNSMFIAKETVQ